MSYYTNDRSHMKQKYLDLIKGFYSQFQRMPSYREMLSLWGLTSKSSANRLIKEWIAEGLFEKQGSIIAPTSKFFAIPFLGTIRAGYPDMPVETIVEQVNLNDYILKNDTRGYYLLKVKGDSMIEAGIFDGDMALIKKDQNPKHGDIVAACIDGEWTLKYFEKMNGRVCLRAGNGKYQNLYPRESLVIGGVLSSVIRKYH